MEWHADYVGPRLFSGASSTGSDSQLQVLFHEGYAIAGSSYKSGGWAIKEGIQNTLALSQRFNGLVGKPDRTLLVGFSQGLTVALASLQKHRGIYDGALAGCGAAGLEGIDVSAAFSLAYAAVFGWPSSWGTVGDVRDDLDYDTEVLPILIAQLSDPNNFPKFEFIRLVSDLPLEQFYPNLATGAPGWFLIDMSFATEVRAELEDRAGGPVVENSGHVYSLSDPDRAYLSQVPSNVIDGWLHYMNTSSIEAEVSARNYVEHYNDFDGTLESPVLTMHGIADPLFPSFMRG